VWVRAHSLDGSNEPLSMDRRNVEHSIKLDISESLSNESVDISLSRLVLT